LITSSKSQGVPPKRDQDPKYVPSPIPSLAKKMRERIIREMLQAEILDPALALLAVLSFWSRRKMVCSLSVWIKGH